MITASLLLLLQAHPGAPAHCLPQPLPRVVGLGRQKLLYDRGDFLLDLLAVPVPAGTNRPLRSATIIVGNVAAPNASSSASS